MRAAAKSWASIAALAMVALPAGILASGFSDALLGDLLPMIDEMAVGECACTVGPVPKGPQHHWVRPDLAVEVKYKELTDQGLLRQPSFSRPTSASCSR